MQSNVCFILSQVSFIDNILKLDKLSLTWLFQITQYLSDPQYYFQVNSQYVRNKLKVILFPFFHRVRAFGTFLLQDLHNVNSHNMRMTYCLL
jgi:hypothetical protein